MRPLRRLILFLGLKIYFRYLRAKNHKLLPNNTFIIEQLLKLFIQVRLRLYVTELFDWLTVKFRLNILSNTIYGFLFRDVRWRVNHNLISLQKPGYRLSPRSSYVRRTLTTLVTELFFLGNLDLSDRRLRVPLTAWVLANQNHLCLFVSRLLKKVFSRSRKRKSSVGAWKAPHQKLLKNY